MLSYSIIRNTTQIYIFLIYYFLATIYMAEIDVNLYKQDEKMRTYCEKKEKRIESKQISTEINPPKPPKPIKLPKKKEVDPNPIHEICKCTGTTKTRGRS